ncbi:MAG TPA: DUF58 domain-containing protein [Xanthobacteraceae bacterium]|nr:DUF58 domain-containing protein [Xanthobacteraceae bacterium]
MIPHQLSEELRYIEIYTSKAARDHRVGDYQSPLRGQGFAFDQHKPYVQGDDYRRIDWNVTARMRQPYVKKTFEDKEMSALIVADLSRSMAVGTQAQAKKELLLQIAATAAFSAICDNMAVGLIGYTDEIELDIPARKGRAHLWHILQSLWEHKPVSPRTDVSVALTELHRRLKDSSVIFCLSDFINEEDIFQNRSLKYLVQRHDFIPLVLEDAWEHALPSGGGFIRLRDAETSGEILIDLSKKNVELYAQWMQEHKKALKRGFYRLHLDHVFLRPGQPYLDALLGLFLARRRRK